MVMSGQLDNPTTLHPGNYLVHIRQVARWARELTLLEKRKSPLPEGIRTWDCSVAIPTMLLWPLFVGVKKRMF